VTVSFEAGAGEREGCLCVADDGKGIKQATREGSSGTVLVEALAKQLQGRIERESPRRGTVVRICFPMRQPFRSAG
jgi:two-component sensor histidine kinase